MTYAIRIRLLALLGVLLIAGCGTSAPVHFYALSANAASPAPPAPSTSISIAVGPVWMSEAVDRPQIVLNTGANSLALEEFSRWAAPLPGNIAQVIAENLVRLLGTPRVAVYPQGPLSDPDFRIELVMLRFNSTPGDAASMEALWTIRTKIPGQTLSGRTVLHEAVAGPGIEELVAAHSRALATFSKVLADAINANVEAGKL